MKKILIIAIVFLIGGCISKQQRIDPCSLDIKHPDYLACVRDVILASEGAGQHPALEDIYCGCKKKFFEENIEK